MEFLKKPSTKFFLGLSLTLVLDFWFASLNGGHVSNETGDLISNVAMVAATLIAASFFTLFVKPEVFWSWFKYLLVWVLPMIGVYNLSEHGGGGFSGINPYATLFPIMLVVFVITTPIYLIIKSRKLKKEEIKPS